jgi:hypothetical protein
MNKQTKFQVGDKAYKPKGYDFPCTIVGVFETVGGDIRVVGEMDNYGLLHIFNEGQLEPVEIITASAEEQLIHLLETQLVDISMMSKIELGDDVIAEINRLKDIIADIKRLQDLYF